MKVEGSVKHEHIVEAAIKRFSHFGINKTTLAEIADDIGISKPSLFYYFHDKSSLLDAVGQKIINEFWDGLAAALTTATSVDSGLSELIEVKRRFFKKYLLLALQAESLEINKASSQLPAFVVKAREKAELLISNLLAQGVAQKTLRPIDVTKTSHLLLETLDAFEQCVKTKSRMLESKDIDSLFDKQQEVIQLLINGLKSKEWKN